MSEVSTIYKDGTYAAKNPRFGDDDAPWKTASAVALCEKHRVSAKSLAEVGCGGGAILIGVADALGAERAVGYEPMREAYAYANKRADDRVSFRNETIDPDSRGDYDLVLCFDVFEHIEDYFGFLRNLKNLGHKFLFHIPLDMNAQMVARGEPIRRVREKVGHLHYFSKDSALEALAECGYQIQDVQYTCGADSTYSGLAYRMMKLPRKVCFKLAPDMTVRTLGGYSLLVLAS